MDARNPAGTVVGEPRCGPLVEVVPGFSAYGPVKLDPACGPAWLKCGPLSHRAHVSVGRMHVSPTSEVWAEKLFVQGPWYESDGRIQKTDMMTSDLTYKRT